METYAVARVSGGLPERWDQSQNPAKDGTSTPLGYVRRGSPLQPKLDPHKDWINEILESDKKVQRKRLLQKVNKESGANAPDLYKIKRLISGALLLRY